MRSPATSSSATLGATASVDTPATSQYESDNPPDCLLAKQSAFTQDFYLDIFFNPIWMSGPNVFSFAKDGTIVRPQTYATEPYPGYHADRTRHLESVNASYFQGIARGDPKLWENVVIIEQVMSSSRGVQGGCGSARCVGGNHTPRCGRRCKVTQA